MSALRHPNYFTPRLLAGPCMFTCSWDAGFPFSVSELELLGPLHHTVEQIAQPVGKGPSRQAVHPC